MMRNLDKVNRKQPIKHHLLLVMFAALCGCQSLPEMPKVSVPTGQAPEGRIEHSRDQQEKTEVEHHSETDSNTFNQDLPYQEPAAVGYLLSTAEKQKESNNLRGAIATIERALRISPRSSIAYLRLAELRNQQGQYADAENLAQKGLAYVTLNRNGVETVELENQLWKVILEARHALGDLKGAREARNKLN